MASRPLAFQQDSCAVWRTGIGFGNQAESYHVAFPYAAFVAPITIDARGIKVKEAEIDPAEWQVECETATRLLSNLLHAAARRPSTTGVAESDAPSPPER